AAFWHLVDTLLAGTTPTLAMPDQLDMKVLPIPGDPNGTASAAEIQGKPVVQQLYAAAFALPKLPGTMSCTTQAGKQYGLTFFTTPEVDLLAVLADAGGCGTVTFDGNDVRLADQAFWSLVHQAEQG